MTKYLKYVLPAILCLGFLLRLGVIVANGPGPSYLSPASTDEVNYRELARNIIENKTFGSWSEGFFTRSMRAPAYPAVLAFANFALGSPWAALVLNLVLDTANILLVHVLARLLFGQRTAIASAILYSVFAPSFIYLRFSTTEIFAVFLVLCLLISLTKYEKPISASGFSLVIFYTLLIHTRPSFLPVLVVLPAVIFLKLGKSAGRRGKILASILPALLVGIMCIPWTLRNYHVQKTLVPVIVIPAWHTLESTNNDISLSADAAMDFIYAPEREGWSEGRYFDEARTQSWRILKKHHVKIFILGVYRIFKSWCFPGFHRRIFLPKAYFNPIPLPGGITMILPDFEGVVYATILCLLLAIFARGKSSLAPVSRLLREKAWLLLFLFSYIAVHVIAIPFPQYRFIVEPVFSILAVAAVAGLLLGKNEDDGKAQDIRFVHKIALSLPFLMLMPLIIPVRRHSFEYPDVAMPPASYRSLREIQWRNNGFIPGNPTTWLQGRLRYSMHGFEFLEKGPSPAKASEDKSVAKLYVDENSEEQPLGIGDVKLNFKNSKDIPRDGDYIICEGTARTGVFRDIIVDVENWEPLR